MFRRTLAIACALAALSGPWAAIPPASAEPTWRTVTSFPKNFILTKSYLKFLDKANAALEGELKINFVGGREAIPEREQAVALRNGAIDVLYAPPNFYFGMVPEGGVLGASDKTPMQVRANGGFEMLNKVMQKKLNGYFLGWFDAGIAFHIFTTKKPPMKADGIVDLSGYKLRSTPITNPFFSDLGATNVQMFIPDVYSALERGLVQGVGVPLFVVNVFSWDKFIKYRLEPGFYQTDVATVVNLNKWNALPASTRDKLQALAIEWEKESYDHFQKLQQHFRDEQAKRGIETLSLGAAGETFRDKAYGFLWRRISAKAPADAVAQLKAKFYK